MGIDIQRDILGLKGQCVNQIKLDEEEGQLVIFPRPITFFDEPGLGSLLWM